MPPGLGRRNGTRRQMVGSTSVRLRYDDQVQCILDSGWADTYQCNWGWQTGSWWGAWVEGHRHLAFPALDCCRLTKCPHDKAVVFSGPRGEY